MSTFESGDGAMCNCCGERGIISHQSVDGRWDVYFRNTDNEWYLDSVSGLSPIELTDEEIASFAIAKLAGRVLGD